MLNCWYKKVEKRKKENGVGKEKEKILGLRNIVKKKKKFNYKVMDIMWY